MNILVMNSGSSSLKTSFLDGDSVESTRDFPSISEVDNDILLGLIGDRKVDAVGHRVVHGGRRFLRAEIITPEVEEEIRSLTPLAPLHQNRSLEGIELARVALPRVPQVACFDTAFHSGMPEAATTYAVPREWRDRLGVRRYGFHGLSHAYASKRCSEMMDRPGTDARIVSCHLGAGASLAAVVGGISVDTTMGFSPLEGLVMATRCGSIDPALPLWLLQHGHLAAEDIQHALEHGSGLIGLAGTSDMRTLLERAESGDSDATIAREVYLRSLRAGIAQMATSMGGLDGLVFTGGVGQRSASIRALAARGLHFLGVAIDDECNSVSDADFEITQSQATVRVFVVSAREELEIARQTRTALVSA